MKNKIKFEIKALTNNLKVRLFKLIKKPVILISSNERQFLKVVDGRSSLINVNMNTYFNTLWDEMNNIYMIKNKMPIILKNSIYYK